MRWYTARLYTAIETGKDRLGRSQVRTVECGCCLVRIAPVNAGYDDTEGNSAHYVRRNFITRKPADYFDDKNIVSFETRGKLYQLEEVTSFENGETMIRGVYYKPEVKDGVQSDTQGAEEA